MQKRMQRCTSLWQKMIENKQQQGRVADGTHEQFLDRRHFYQRMLIFFEPYINLIYHWNHQLFRKPCSSPVIANIVIVINAIAIIVNIFIIYVNIIDQIQRVAFGSFDLCQSSEISVKFICSHQRKFLYWYWSFHTKVNGVPVLRLLPFLRVLDVGIRKISLGKKR